MKNKEKIIFIEIEIAQRELYPKIVLALELAKKEYTVYLGESESIFNALKFYKNSIYIGKNIFNYHSSFQDNKKVNQLHKNNHTILYLHEEGLIYPGDIEQQSEVLQSLYPKNYLNSKDYILYWGHYTLALEKREVTGNKIITGNPRFSLFKYLDNNNLESKKRNILICGKWNAVLNSYGINNQRRWQSDFAHVDLNLATDYIANELNAVSYILKLIPLLCVIGKKYNLDVVYRPHPSEEDTFLIQKLFSNISNFKVDSVKPLFEQLLYSEIILSEGCTTAIDSYCANKIFVELPFNFKKLNVIPSDFAFTVDSHEDLLIFLEHYLSNKIKNIKSNFKPPKKEETLSYYLNDISNDSIKNICSLIDSIKLKSISTISKKDYVLFILSNKYKTIKRKIKLSLLNYLSSKIKDKTKWEENFFPGISLREINYLNKFLKNKIPQDLKIKIISKWLIRFN